MTSSLTVFGVGPQAYWHVKLTLILFPNIKSVTVVNRSYEKAQEFAKELKKDFGTNIATVNAYSYQVATHTEIINQKLSGSCVVFGCLPSTSPAIDFSALNKDPKVPVFVSLIGSYKPTMRELDLSALKASGKKLVVDTAEGVFEEAGEVADAGLSRSQMVELAQLSKTDRQDFTMAENIVVQKIVGMSNMDLVVAKMLIGSTGTTFDGF
ncbi:hypothetical protein PGUG_02363 [Meyerozyma guilliermondii ATCC 6260]|uniref:Quinate/shikimate 5-dehydrogenase/glutamyl-tRNA reductase domain-containing protein n=1 Tax=Meyerozyma guilliermondii (strain ATCC 6260 / CBS 566 / DSM 6381 / JCM 1539 / NBRC 10279 / NRRL Y-324) TaxID=294746 RepID=A5DGG2_PICGU|nr:uncharacterized protein PGUG_02363 [Meyerozyma guilliermondii ATCC 6260]EDK38265.2 hypothetical protein PGUG_02363 [Meyerozyma guilliermondii ATCC 6260]